MLGEAHAGQHVLHFASNRAQVPGIQQCPACEIRLPRTQRRRLRHNCGTQYVSSGTVTSIQLDIVRIVFQDHELGVYDRRPTDPAEEAGHLPRAGGPYRFVPPLRARHFGQAVGESALTVKEKKRDRQPLDCGFRGPESNIPEIRQQ